MGFHQLSPGIEVGKRKMGIGEISHNDFARTKVVFTEVSDEEINYYLGNEDYKEKAGAYAIQGRTSAFVKKIDGWYFNVMGFPLSVFYTMLKKIGINIYS